MSTQKFPDENIYAFVMDTINSMNLEVRSFSNKECDPSGLLKETRDWEWNLARPSSPIVLSIGVLEPSLILNISFHYKTSNDPKNDKMFFFSDYLEQKNFTEDFETIQKIVKEGTWKQNGITELKILKKHLESGLAAVMDDKEWPNVIFDWYKYLYPEAQEKVYEDQLKIINKAIKQKKSSGWIYFLDVFRSKKNKK